VEGADDESVRRREAVAAGELGAVVEHPHIEIDVRRQSRQRLRDVPAADEQERDPRQSRQKGDSAAHRRPRAGDERVEMSRDSVPGGGGGQMGHPAGGRVEQVTVADR
jgi:hypothetical protein